MRWITHALLASALCLACGVRHGADAGVSELYLGDQEEDEDGCGDPYEPEHDDDGCSTGVVSPGPASTMFVALPDVPIYILEYPGMFAGQTAWFADDPETGAVSHAFYVVPTRDGAAQYAGEGAAVRNFRRVCEARRCRRGETSDVRAAWSAQMDRWASDEHDSFPRAIADASP